MVSPTKKLKKPSRTASFKEYMLFYMNRKGWNQTMLAAYARLNQSHLCKIINGNYERTKMEVFVSLCLVLQLSESESKDLLARAERAFSPASALHEVYKDLIMDYSMMHGIESAGLAMLDYADNYLVERGYDPLPTIYSSRKK